MRRLDPVLLAIVVVGLALRLVGLRWGLPCAEHAHSYHPDEIQLVVAAANTSPLLGDLTTGFYNYGSFVPLLLRLVYDVAGVFAPVPPVEWEQAARIHLLGRLLTVLFGTATLLLAYDIGRRLGRSAGPVPASGTGAPAAPDRLAGLCAAGLLAVAPLHVAHSHYLTVDVPATFWATASLCAALRLLEAPRLRMALLAGACAGLAAATKYNAGLVVAAALAALALCSWYRRSVGRPPEVPPSSGGPGRAGAPGPLRRWSRRRARRAAKAAAAEVVEITADPPEPDPPAGDAGPDGVSPKRRALLALACLGAAALALLAACPGILLETQTFVEHFLFELNHVRTGHGDVFKGTAPAWMHHVTASLRFGLGIPLLAVTLAGVVQAVRRRSPADLVVAAWVIPYYVLIGTAQVKFMRYTLPLVPVLMAWTGVLCADWLSRAARSRLRALAAAVVVGAGFWTAGAAVTYAILFTTADPRDRAAEWIRAALRPGASVGLTSIPWFYTPPLVPWNGNLWTRREFEQMRPRWPYAFLPGGPGELRWTARRLAAERPHCFITSNLEEQIRDGLRLDLPEARRLVMALERQYRKEVFAPLVTWPGLFGPGYPPEDWAYPAPTVTVYVRR